MLLLERLLLLLSSLVPVSGFLGGTVEILEAKRTGNSVMLRILTLDGMRAARWDPQWTFPRCLFLFFRIKSIQDSELVFQVPHLLFYNFTCF